MRMKTMMLRAGLVALLSFCLIAYLAGSLASMAVDPEKMLQKMNQYADTSASDVSEDEYPALAFALTDYLKGKAEEAQISIIMGERVTLAFSQKELLHLKDIKDLVGLANILRYTALSLILLSITLFFWLRKRKPEFLHLIKPQKVFSTALWTLFTAAGSVIIWGLIDFKSLFYAFHRLLFRNDLWLLDPGQDLLLQLMPSSFFISYGRDLIQNSAAIMLSLPLAAYALRKGSSESV